MRKKIGIMLLAGCMSFPATFPLSAATLVYDGKKHEYNLPAITLFVNGKEIETTSMAPIQLDNRVLVPTREVFTPMGATVKWDGTAKKVTIIHKGNTLVLTVNQKQALFNGKTVTLDVPAKIINDKVMIPVRFISEQFGFTVDWIGSKRWVCINEPVGGESKPEELPSTGTGEKNYTGQVNKHKISLSTASYAQTQVTSVNVSESSNVSTTTIKASSPISKSSVQVYPGKIVVDIANSKSKLNNSITPPSNTYIQNIRTSQFDAETTRIVLDLKSGALVNASFNGDRTGVVIKLTKQSVEQIKLTKKSNADEFYIKGLTTNQVKLTPNLEGKTISFTIDHAALNSGISWTNLNYNYVNKVIVNNGSEQVKGTIYLKEKVDYQLKNTDLGVNLTLAKQAGSTPDQGGDEVPDLKPEVSPTQGMVYIAEKKPIIQLNQITGLTQAAIKVKDDYRNRQITFDLGKDYSSKLKNKVLTIGDSAIKKIEVVTNGTTKIVVSTQKVYAYNITSSSSQVKLELLRPKEKYKQIIVVDAGHGGSDGGSAANNVQEKALNYKQAMALYELLEADPNIKVYMTRETDTYPTLQFRSELANDIDADLFVSVHNNAASPSVRGTEVLYYPSSTDKRGESIAQLVQNAIVKNCGMVNRGIKTRSDLYVLRTTNMPAILIETGFITNATEAALMDTSSFNTKWAKAVYNSIVEGFKLL